MKTIIITPSSTVTAVSELQALAWFPGIRSWQREVKGGVLYYYSPEYIKQRQKKD